MVLVALGLADREDALGLSQNLKPRVVNIWRRQFLHFLLFKAIEKLGSQVVPRALTHLARGAVLTWTRCQEVLRQRGTLSVTETGGWGLGSCLFKVRVVNVRRGKPVLVLVLQIVFLSQTGTNAVVGALLGRIAGGGCVLCRAGFSAELLGSEINLEAASE